MEAHGRDGAADNGACPARRRGNAAHRRAGRDETSGPKRPNVVLAAPMMVIVRRRVVPVRRIAASSRCLVAPDGGADPAHGTKGPGLGVHGRASATDNAG